MYHNIQEFLKDRKVEESNTLKIFNLITDEAINQKIHPNVRSLGRLAWHITETLPEMGTAAGLFDSGYDPTAPIPATMQEIIADYKENSEKFREAVVAKWTDAELGKKLPMYGMQWEKGLILRIINTHEAHHRSQMTIVMRMLDLPVAGIYGPTKEDWAKMGMAAME